MLFVVGNARSGTKTIARVLECASNTVAHHEGTVYPWLELEAQGYRGECCRAQIKRYLPSRWATRAAKAGKIAADSNHYFSPFISQIAELLPRSKFIYLLRNPADIIRSWMNLGFPMHDGYLKTTVYEKYRWRPFPPEMTSRFSRLCTYWVKTNERMLASLRDTNHIVVKIEELRDRLGQIWEFACLDGGMEKAIVQCKKHYNRRKASIKPPFLRYPNWDAKQKRIFDKTVAISAAYRY
jgi:hypothetical protein